MELIEKRQAKDRLARLGATSLLACYCLLAVFTSVPSLQNSHSDVAAEPIALIASAKQASRGSEAASRPRQMVGNEWWNTHQNIAALDQKWWQNHQANEVQRNDRVRVANLVPPVGIAGTADSKTTASPIETQSADSPALSVPLPKNVVTNKVPPNKKTTAKKGVPLTPDRPMASSGQQAVKLPEQDKRAAKAKNVSTPPAEKQIVLAKPVKDPADLARPAPGADTQTRPAVVAKRLAPSAVQPVKTAGFKPMIMRRVPKREKKITDRQSAERSSAVVLSNFLPTSFRPPHILPEGQKTTAPGLIRSTDGGKIPAIVRNENLCVADKIAGWSGITPLEGYKEAPAPLPAEQGQISPLLKARLELKGFEAGSAVFMRIFKDRSKLQVWLKKGGKFALFHTYDICRWSGSFGPKLYEGDKQSPEGFYLVNRQLFNRPSWKWKGSFSIGYPNAYDKLHGRTGSLILVHGGCTSSGCFAMTNPVIKEVRELAQLARENGQEKFSVHVFPFELTTANLARHEDSPWSGFWKNLKTGYDLFEENRLPPRVRVCNKHYVFAMGDEQQGSQWSGKGCYGLAAYIPGWKPLRTAAKRRARSARTPRAGARCNSRRASCRKWIALKNKRLAKRRKSAKRHRRLARKVSSRRRATFRRARAIGRRKLKNKRSVNNSYP